MKTLHPGQQKMILCEFSHECIRDRALASFLDHWTPDKLPSGPALRPLMDSMVFQFQGSAAAPRPTCIIPEVRLFCQELFERWPFWFFAAHLGAPSLQIMVLACLPSLQMIQEEGKDFCRVQFAQAELDGFIQRGLVAMECLCKRAGMSNAEMAARSQLVLDYFRTDWQACLPQPTDPPSGCWK